MSMHSCSETAQISFGYVTEKMMDTSIAYTLILGDIYYHRASFSWVDLELYISSRKKYL